MSIVILQRHASRFTSLPSPKSRDIAAEAYRKAIEDLNQDVKATAASASWAEHHVSIIDIRNTVAQAIDKYNDTKKECTGARLWLERFSVRIVHYGKVFDVLAQHHPEYVALAWGALKFVLIVSLPTILTRPKLIGVKKGVIERATILEEFAKALVTIGEVLPHADLSAELYQTDYMKDALSKLYLHIIRFFHLCVQWFSKGSVGRFFSSLKDPFTLRYEGLVDKIKEYSAIIQDLANTEARVEIRDIGTRQGIHHDESMTAFQQLLQYSIESKAATDFIMKALIAQKTLSENTSVDVGEIKRTIFRIEFHHVVQLFAPDISPALVLTKVQSLCRRNPTITLSPHQDFGVKRKLYDWALSDKSYLLIVRMGTHAQKQARELAAEVIRCLSGTDKNVSWNISLPLGTGDAGIVSNVFKSIVHQLLQRSPSLFAQYVEQLNLTKVNSFHTDSEWADLLCLLFVKVPEAYLVIETGDLHKAHTRTTEWAVRFLKLLQRVVDHAIAAGNCLKVLVVVYENPLKKSGAPLSGYETISFSRSAPIPRRMRHMARRTRAGHEGLEVAKVKDIALRQ